MAQVVKHTFKQAKASKQKAKPYPWATWLNGETWELTAGEDFDIHPLMFERTARSKATIRGAKVEIEHDAEYAHVYLRRSDIKSPTVEAKEQKAAKRKQAKADKAAPVEAPSNVTSIDKKRSKKAAEPVAEAPTRKRLSRPEQRARAAAKAAQS